MKLKTKLHFLIFAINWCDNFAKYNVCIRMQTSIYRHFYTQKYQYSAFQASQYNETEREKKNAQKSNNDYWTIYERKNCMQIFEQKSCEIAGIIWKFMHMHTLFGDPMFS